jgi:hypothetical protein
VVVVLGSSVHGRQEQRPNGDETVPTEKLLTIIGGIVAIVGAVVGAFMFIDARYSTREFADVRYATNEKLSGHVDTLEIKIEEGLRRLETKTQQGLGEIDIKTKEGLSEHDHRIEESLRQIELLNTRLEIKVTGDLMAETRQRIWQFEDRLKSQPEDPMAIEEIRRSKADLEALTSKWETLNLKAQNF